MVTDRDRLVSAIDRLERLYYLLATLDDRHQTYLANMRRNLPLLPKHSVSNVLASLTREIGKVRRETKCLLSDDEILELVAEMATAGDGYVYLSKSYIDRHLFGNYARTFPRWPHVPIHALVPFDTKMSAKSQYALFVAEAELFDDAKLAWEEAKPILADGMDFRTRDRSRQRRLYSFLRLTATGIYRFLEAYLNGIAYSCFQTSHKGLTTAEHALLAEWDTEKKRPRFVAFEEKLKRYPVVCAKYLGRTVAVHSQPYTRFLAEEGKLLRDSLTHPSPYQNFATQDPGKIAQIIRSNPAQVKHLFSCSIDYVRSVEKGLGRDPEKSVPWLNSDFL